MYRNMRVGHREPGYTPDPSTREQADVPLSLGQTGTETTQMVIGWWVTSQILWVLWRQSSNSLFKSLHRSSVAKRMAPLAQRTLSMMTMRASLGLGYLGSEVTSHLSPAPWPTLPF